MRIYEVDKDDYKRLKDRNERPEQLICMAIMNLDVQPVTAAPKETVKIRLYLAKEEFKTLDRKAKAVGVSTASVIRGITMALARR
ncbi:MAG TPA: hypothetical protein VFG19_04845 [Geobacteraceae bacterium]|nr:hypothetical protein [Geobacteraceae bacterium]